MTSDDLGLDENNTMNLETSYKNTIESTLRNIDHSLANNLKLSNEMPLQGTYFLLIVNRF